jgi:SAM-dependent MidA family methyltransferase
MAHQKTRLKNLIKLKGKISIADFIEEAMFNPLDGYYRIQKPIGKESDFITAPEISSLFGRLIGAYLFGFIAKSPHKMAFIEAGAGLGTLFHDISDTFLKLGQKMSTKPNLTHNIIEISEELTKIQQNKLKDNNISWFSDFENCIKNNQNRQLFFVANELFDCFAIHQFARTNEKWQEVMISLKNDQFCLILEEFSEKKHDFIEKIANENAIQKQKTNIIFEHSFKAQNFMTQLSKSLKKQGGMAIIIDYGYVENPLKSTLQAIKSHQKQDFLQNVGQSDLTSLVNFSMLENIAKKHELQTSLLTQGQFLSSLLETSKISLEGTKKEAFSRLIDADKMGELFKCLIIWDNVI